MTDFQTKRLELVCHLEALHELLQTRFPVGGPITWRQENSFNESGTVTQHIGRGRIRVTDDRAQFHTTITVDDIVRATP